MYFEYDTRYKCHGINHKRLMENEPRFPSASYFILLSFFTLILLKDFPHTTYASNFCSAFLKNFSFSIIKRS